ncbi:glycine oxidase ThiO [Effusibacillus consociatus]|uniref:glycine oxidase n=1 Tax=Effusibacillus consociatus TaxID=1117041 RepID=A0ABV9PVT7_9BACL
MQGYDVCIVGGGIIGCSIAYNLAKRGLRSVVIEKNALGSESTQAGAGMLGAQVEMEKPGALFDLGILSRALFRDLQQELKELSGVDIELQTSGILRLAVSEEDRRSLLDRREWQSAAGQKTEWLEDDDLRKEVGDLFGSTYGALFLPKDHQIRAMAFLRALVSAAGRLGTVFLEHTELIGFVRKGDRIVGIETNNGPFAADAAVIAAGAWSGIVGKMAGLELPVFPVKGQSILADFPTPVTPFTVFTHGTYMVPKVTGHLYIGATMEMAGFDKTATLQGLNRLLSDAARIMPSVGKLGWSGNLVGLRPGSQDGLPFLGQVPGLDGLYVASGHFRNGLLLSPITGVVMAELITSCTPRVDLSPFRVSRLW